MTESGFRPLAERSRSAAHRKALHETILRSLQRDHDDITATSPVTYDFADFFERTSMDGPRQSTDPALATETVADLEHDRVLGEEVGLCGELVPIHTRDVGKLFHELDRTRLTGRPGCVPTRVPQHRTRLDRGELIFVPEQDQPRLHPQGREQSRHHLQIDHRGLVDHHHIGMQGVIHVMAEMSAARPAAEQSMEGDGLPGNTFPQVLRQLGEGAGDGLTDPRRRLSGGGSQLNPESSPLGERDHEGARAV